MKKILSALFVTLMLAPTLAFSQAYIAGSVGQADIDEDSSDFDKPTSFSVSGGWKFSDYFALELSYVNFGKAEDDIEPIWTIEASGVDLGLVVIAPVAEKFEIYGRVGYMSWDAKLKEKGYGTLAKDDGEDINYGAGFAFKPTENVALFLEYHIYEFDDVDVNNASVGIRLSF